MKTVCIVGCGHYGLAHARAFRRAGARLFFSSRRPGRAREFARRFRGTAAGNFRSTLKDPRVDGVVLCSPHDRHLPDALAALKAGKAVLLEKPLARSVAECRRVIGELRRRRGRLMLAENYLFLPHIAPLRRLLASGAIGRPRRCSIRHYWPKPVTGWRRSRRRMGGGVFIDLGVHYLRLLQVLFGKPLALRTVFFERRRPEMEGESEIEVELRFPRGVFGRIALSWTRTLGEEEYNVRIEGERGALYLPQFRPEIRIAKGPRPEIRRLPWDDPRGNVAVARAFLHLLRGGRPAVTAEDGLADVALVSAAYRSAAKGGIWRSP